MNADLIEKYLNGSLTATEAAMLAQAMEEHPSLADEFAAMTRMEADLGGAFREDARTALYTRRMERAVEETEPVTPRRRWVRPAAAAAGFALLAGAAWAWLGVPQKGIAQKKQPDQRSGGIPASAPGGDFAMDEKAARDADPAGLKRKLRKFAASATALRKVPVSQALSVLEQQWKSYPHRNTKESGVTFALSTAARSLWPKPEDEPVVSLEIPGISLLTSVELVAAQAGLLAKVSGTGVSLEPDTRQDDGKPRHWTLPLAAATFDAFLSRASSETERSQQQMVQRNLHVSYSMTGAMALMHPSWMEAASPESGSAVVTDGMTVDLDIPPEVVEFEGFIDYGLPIQTTGINALDTSLEPVVITDSGLLQPEETATTDSFIHEASYTQLERTFNSAGLASDANYAYIEQASSVGGPLVFTPPPAQVEFSGTNPILTPSVPSSAFKLMTGLQAVLTAQPSATLSRLLAAHGSNGADVQWDNENGSLTARGSLRELRATGAALTALQESANTLASAEVKIIEWPDSPVPVNSAQPAGTVITSRDLSALLHKANSVTANIVSYPRVLSAYGKGITANSTTPVERPDGSSMRAGVETEMNEISREGFAHSISAKVVLSSVTGSEMIEGRPWPVREATVGSGTYRLEEGEQLRFDFHATGERKACTVLMSVRTVTR
jgi:hypothetical protein